MVCGRSVDDLTDNIVLHCTGGLYQTVFQCPPSETCVNIVGHDQVRCGDAPGTYFAKEGIACVGESSQACSFDQQVVLRCSQGIWSTAIHCPPSSCVYRPQTSTGCTGTWCANCGYTPGDQCNFGADAQECSTDLSKILDCTDGTATIYRDCGNAHCSPMTIDGIPLLGCG